MALGIGILHLHELFFIVFILCTSGVVATSHRSSMSFIQRTHDPQPITESAPNKSLTYKETTETNSMNMEEIVEYMSYCPSYVECSKLGGECINCKFNYSCVYGQETTVECEAHKLLNCSGNRAFNRTFVCRYCYQTETWEHYCFPNFSCKVVSNPRDRELQNCSVRSDVVCLGNRRFRKYPLCNWTDGYKWSTALILSITLGGFGADRFYLGHWQEGIGKLFSFGGLGIWTLLDVILISVGYLSPADGSLYI